jgi:localization factor PodJL
VLGSSHFVAAPAAPAGDGLETTAATASGEALPVALASASPESGPVADGPQADGRIGSQKLIDAAAHGDPAAAFEVAARYAEGDRLPKNLAKAAEWYERAAEGGIAVAQYRLASLYERGQGVAKDLTKAVNWYQRAADQGNVNAMHNLAVLMSVGVDGPPDQAKALQWFRAAADYGVRDSQYNLGVIYARGLGPAQDLVESYKWFAVAAREGDSDAALRREEVAEALPPADLAKARAAAEAWRVKASLAEANGVGTPDGGWDDPGDALVEADRQALVKKIQTLLAEQGYDPGPADGVAGPKTRQAVKDFQRKLGAPATGQIDNRLVAALVDGQT